jgi:hypothetical protein
MSLRLVVFLLSAAVLSAAENKPATPAPSRQGAAQSGEQVTVISDGETWVSITNVRVPEQRKTISYVLPPGEYEVVGRRKGFRDVRQTVRVRKGDGPITLTVICTESSQRE